jgi:hypothetical protein
VRTALSDRNRMLNNAGWKLARFVRAGLISRAEIEAALTPAAFESGLTRRETRDTLRSALR